MRWNVSVGVRLNDDIEADSVEEAKQIARMRALEDVDFNNAELDDYYGITVYCALADEEDEDFDEKEA